MNYGHTVTTGWFLRGSHCLKENNLKTTYVILLTEHPKLQTELISGPLRREEGGGQVSDCEGTAPENFLVTDLYCPWGGEVTEQCDKRTCDHRTRVFCQCQSPGLDTVQYSNER